MRIRSRSRGSEAAARAITREPPGTSPDQERLRTLRRRPAAAVALGAAFACVWALVPAVASGGAPQSPRPTPSNGLTAPVAADATVSRPPVHLTRGVGSHELVHVSAFQWDGDGVAVVTERARGRDDATAVVRELQSDPATTSVAVADPVHIATTDTEFGEQWALPRLRLPEAWATSDGSGITIAVIDTGVDITHPDLAGKLVPGVEFVGLESSDDVADGHGHGTHVAGTVAAVTDNGVGVAGVAPAAMVMPIKALADNGSGWSGDVAEAVVYAVDHGAHVINLSLSSSANSVLAQAVEYARSRGVVVVAAGGNARTLGSPTAYPAALPGVIAVAATDETDTDAAFSNLGRYIDVAAPGVRIRSTRPGGVYGDMSGTSMAAPHVSALAALLLAEIADEGPVDSDDPVFDLLTRTAQDLGAPGWDPAYGYGLVDPVAALAAVIDGLPPSRSGPPPEEPDPTPGESPAPATSPAPTLTPTPTPTPTPTQQVTPRPDSPRAVRVMLQRPPVAVRWNPPATGAVATYTVRIGRVEDGQVSWRRSRSTRSTHAVIDVTRGRWRVQVRAVNSAGTSPAAKESFTITRALLRLTR